MSIQDEIAVVKKQISVLQENLRELEACLEDDES